MYTHSDAEPTLASRGDVGILLNICVVQTSIKLHHHVHRGRTLGITSMAGFELEWNCRAEKGGGHTKEGHKENGKKLHCGDFMDAAPRYNRCTDRLLLLAS